MERSNFQENDKPSELENYLNNYLGLKNPFLSFHLMLKLSNLQNISIPIEDPNFEIKKDLKKKIEDEVYNIGKIIASQKFQRTVIKNDIIQTEVFEIGGIGRLILKIFDIKL